MQERRLGLVSPPLKFTFRLTDLVIFISVVFLIITVTLNAVLISPLFELGVNFINLMQKEFNSKVFAVFMNIFSLICDTPIIAAIFLLEMGIAKSKLKVIVHLSFFLIGFHLIAIFKLAYQQTRPLWASLEISKWSWFCPTDFGNPSGHSYVAFPLFEPLISQFIGFNIFKGFCWVLLLFLALVVPYSRTYLGVHSVNQIFFGFTFGVFWTLLYRYSLRQKFYKIFTRMLKLKKPKHLIALIVMHLFLTIIPVIVFAIRSKISPLNQMDLENLNKICQLTLTSLSIQSSMLALCILHSPAFGMMYGLFALKDTKSTRNYFLGKWHYKNYGTAFLHCLAQVLCAGVVPVGVVLGLGSFWRQPYSKFFGFNASLVSGGFLFIWLIEKIQRKYKLIVYSEEEERKIQGFQAGIELKSGDKMVESKNW